MSTSEFRNKNLRRPRKSDAERERRYRVHRQRLIALGLPEERVEKMTPPEMRAILQHPTKLPKA
jgi:hypothetical protein